MLVTGKSIIDERMTLMAVNEKTLVPTGEIRTYCNIKCLNKDKSLAGAYRPINTDKESIVCNTCKSEAETIKSKVKAA
jgi:hypothetical protein